MFIGEEQEKGKKNSSHTLTIEYPLSGTLPAPTAMSGRAKVMRAP